MVNEQTRALRTVPMPELRTPKPQPIEDVNLIAEVGKGLARFIFGLAVMVAVPALCMASISFLFPVSPTSSPVMEYSAW